MNEIWAGYQKDKPETCWDTKVFNVHKQNIISIQIFMLPKPYNLQWYVYNNEALLVITILFS